MKLTLPGENRLASFEEAAKHMPAGEENFPPPFAEAIPVAADAPLIDQLIAWNGRALPA